MSRNKFRSGAFNQVVARLSALAPIVALLAVTCAACGARTDTAANEKPSEPIAATVGTDVITVGEVDGLLAEARPIFRTRGRLFPAKNDPYYADLRDEAVRYLVERRLREQLAEQLGVDVSAATRENLLDFRTWQAVARARKPGETMREALASWRRVLDERFDRVTYAPHYRPAEQRRSIPPELRRLPEPRASCDLKDGMYPILVARAHGCLGPEYEDLSYIAPQCPEIPAEPDHGFTGEELDTGYADYVTSGTAAHDFFEPLTTNREDLASEENPEGPECQAFPGGGKISVGDVGFRSVPLPGP